MTDELTDIRNQQYENAVRQRENLEMAIRAQEQYESLRKSIRRGRTGRGSQDTDARDTKQS